MDASDHIDEAIDADATVARQRMAEVTALWAALEADRMAQDERTARLRIMRLADGDGAAA